MGLRTQNSEALNANGLRWLGSFAHTYKVTASLRQVVVGKWVISSVGQMAKIYEDEKQWNGSCRFDYTTGLESTRSPVAQCRSQ